MKRREYLVQQVKKRGFLSGPLDAPKLQAILNEKAQQGWIFDKALNSETFFLEKDTFLLVFYKEVD